MNSLILAKTPYLTVSDEYELFDGNEARVQCRERETIPGHQLMKHLLAVDPYLIYGDLCSVFGVSVNLHQVK